MEPIYAPGCLGFKRSESISICFNVVNRSQLPRLLTVTVFSKVFLSSVPPGWWGSSSQTEQPFNVFLFVCFFFPRLAGYVEAQSPCIPLWNLIKEWEPSEPLGPAAWALAPRLLQFICLGQGGKSELRFKNFHNVGCHKLRGFQFCRNRIHTTVFWIIPSHAQVKH